MTDNDQNTEQQLTPKQEALIAALCSGLSITAAAQASGIGDKTAKPCSHALRRAGQNGMSNILSLSRKIDRMYEKIIPAHKTWVLVVEEGASIPAHIRSQIKPRDTVVIREVPRGGGYGRKTLKRR